MQVLSECELIEADQQGREIYYKLKIEKMKEIDKWLEQFRRIWEKSSTSSTTYYSNFKINKNDK